MPNKPCVPEGRRVYAIGDVHGRADLLKLMLDQINEDAAKTTADEFVLIFLGDYVDRGPESDKVLGLVSDGLPGFAKVALMGNHERLMLDALHGDDPSACEQWLLNGGSETLSSYGIEPSTDITTFSELHRCLPPSHRQLLESLRLSHVEGDYLFAHAGINPARNWDDQIEDDLIWIRDEFLNSTADFGKIVVHGHTIGRAVIERSNRIGLDTAAYRSGILSGIVLEGVKRRIINAVQQE